MHPFAEVHLGDGVEAAPPIDVDEQPDLDSVAVGERHSVESGAPAGTLPRKGLRNCGEVGEEAAEEGLGEELGGSAALLGVSVERTPVGRLDEMERLVDEYGDEERRDEPGGGQVGDVGVEEDQWFCLNCLDKGW